jgi:hypothetical protein
MRLDKDDPAYRAILLIGEHLARAEWQQGYSANGGGSKSQVSATPCHLGTVTNAGVRLSCGGENLLIPAKVG